jgi:very-short-patch-repair endonuclease
MLQTEALEILKTGSNVFLTGVPGAGKSFVINQYVKWLEDKGIYPSITASTGIAATHIGGRTLHSFVGIGVVHYLNEQVIDKIMERESLYKKLLNTQVLIIDEISMLDAKVLDKVDAILKAVKKSEKAFGGMQIIFVGDFFQLPPVTKRGEETKYFAFMSKAWKEARPLVCYLEEQFRQTDETFTKLLMAIREDNVDEYHIEILEDLKKKTFKKLGLELPKENSTEEYIEEEIDYGIPIPDPSPSGKGGVQSYLTGNKKNFESLQLRALEMRKNPTEEEEYLWEELKDNKLDAHIRRQHVIDNFIADFISIKDKLIIEVDGEIHNNQAEKDEERTKIFNQLGFRVLRFTNDEVINNIENVLIKITLALKALPEGEGLGGDTSIQPDILELHSHNKNVDEINDLRLKNIPGREYVYEMLTQGRLSLVENLQKSCLSPVILKLKLGAKVIFTKNSMDGKYVNGTLGVVKDLDKDAIIVETKDGKLIDVKHEEWEHEEGGKVKARISQYPLRLAWAITVHKSQGMSLDEAVISLGETFEFGQGYVALSRLRSLEGLYLKSFNQKSLQVNPAVCEFDEKIRKDSRFIQQKFQKSLSVDKEKIKKLQEDFILRCGGVVEGGVMKKEKESKKPTVEVTFDMIKSGKSMEEIIEERDLKFESIIKHVEELYKLTKLEKLDLDKLSPEHINIFSVPNDVKKSFRKFKTFKDEEGKIKLAPVFKDLKEKYSYEDLRWYRLVL